LVPKLVLNQNLRALRMRRYDFGGGESIEEGTTHVIDILPKDEVLRLNPNYTGQVIYGDITMPLALPPTEHINVSQVLRYHNSESNFLQDDIIDFPKLRRVAHNIHYALRPGGTVHIFDHCVLASLVTGMLIPLGYTVTRAELINPADADCPEEWRFELTKGQ